MPDAVNRRRLRRVEIVTVVVIVGVLLLLLPPAIQASRESARRGKCSYNLKEHGLGLSLMAGNKGFLAGTVQNLRLPPEKRLSWYVDVWPFEETAQNPLLVNSDQPWDSATNLAPKIKDMIFESGAERTKTESLERHNIAVCPSMTVHPTPKIPHVTSYVGIAGLGADAPTLPSGHERAGIWGYDRRTFRRNQALGPASTLLLAETASENGPWTAGGPPTMRGLVPEGRPYLGGNGQFGGIHPGGGNVAFGDASVRFLANDTDPSVLAAMVTIAGNKPHGK